jgi:hypothetical protein
MLMNESRTESLPQAFCWTRFGPEAGEAFDRILRRKNIEREACDGVFYWGIGSSVAPALSTLISEVERPEVLFSPICSAPRSVDVQPATVVRWLAGTGLFGESVVLPPGACVTSRWDPDRPNFARYALVCASDEPLALRMHGSLDFAALRNLTSGAHVGSSQVTAVVRRNVNALCPTHGRVYEVAMRAWLVYPYLIRLSSPSNADAFRRQAPAVEHRSLQLSF